MYCTLLGHNRAGIHVKNVTCLIAIIQFQIWVYKWITQDKCFVIVDSIQKGGMCKEPMGRNIKCHDTLKHQSIGGIDLAQPHQ